MAPSASYVSRTMLRSKTSGRCIAALQCEKIIREYRLVDGHVGVKGEGSCFNDLHATRNLMFYLANVMVEVYDEPNVEADYAKLDVYAIAKYPRRPTNA
jgi:hypothetical protein